LQNDEDELVEQNTSPEYALLTPESMEPASNEGASENIIMEAEPTRQYFTLPSRYDRPGTFELMKLPTELRLRIFYFLAPRTPTTEPLLETERYTWAYYRERNRFLFYHDAILRTNRKIYGEVIELWYSTACYRVSISQSLRFLNREFQHPSQLPYGFQFLAHVTLEVRLCSGVDEAESLLFNGDKVRRREESQHEKWLRYFVDLFKPSGSGRLQNLSIEVRPGFHFFTPVGMRYPSGVAGQSRPERQYIVYAILEHSLRPLREMRVSGRVSVGESNRFPVGFLCCDIGTIKDVRIVTEEYVRRLDREISGNVDRVERKGELGVPAKNSITLVT
jgi:hypothetical protein